MVQASLLSLVRRRRGSGAVVSLVVMALVNAAAAKDEPEWEAGLGVGAVYFPDYRGADHATGYAVPLPYFVYRGDFLRADRNGLRGVLFNSERLSVDLSVNATVPAQSRKNQARAGMPNLAPTIELGPNLNLVLARGSDEAWKLDFRLPLRSAYTLERSPRHIGYVAAPNLSLDVADFGAVPGLNLGLLAGPLFASAAYHEYFYGVDAVDATPNRPIYSAHGGYGGTQFLVSLSKRYPRFWIGAFSRFDALGGAVFDDSPLVRRRSYFAAGIGCAWIIGESSTRVDREEP